jgi:hypothetical protein
VDWVNAIVSWFGSLGWSGFLPTLLATVAGAAIGVFGVVWATRSQAQAAYRASMIEALALVVGAFPARMLELDQYGRDLEDYDEYIDRGGDGETPPPPEPAPYEIATRIEAARMIASEADQPVLGALAEAFYAVGGLLLPAQRARLSRLPEMLRLWQSGAWSRDRALAEFIKFRETAESGTGYTVPPAWKVSRRGASPGTEPRAQAEEGAGSARIEE